MLRWDQVLVALLLVRETPLGLACAFIGGRLVLEELVFFSQVRHGLGLARDLHVKHILTELEETLELRLLNLVKRILLLRWLLTSCSCLLMLIRLGVDFVAVVTLVHSSLLSPADHRLLLRFWVALRTKSFHESPCGFGGR